MSKEGRAVLVLGSGNSLDQRIRLIPNDDFSINSGKTFPENFADVWTIDKDPAAKAKITWDLEATTPDGYELSWPVPEHFFNEVHAYEVLEHLGAMGDYRFFFALWRKIWRVLKPGGIVCATTPWWQSVWAWQDPGHRRVYSVELLTYLVQKQYEEQVGKTSMTDYRSLWPKPYDFTVLKAEQAGENPLLAGFTFVLQKEGSFAGTN